jgi:[ribosomal protein S5]-alanine N-acetyltransferase
MELAVHTNGDIRTARLLLSEPRSSDIAPLFRFMGDRMAMQFTQAINSLQACEHHVMTHEAQRAKIGCAPWVVREWQEQHAPIVGWGGLYDDPFDPGWGIELAYYFAPEAWGRGLATELAEASLTIARDALTLAKVTAFAHPDNLASRRVLSKAGFIERRFVPEMTRYLFEVELQPRPSGVS